jgi:hypothetical protein
VPRELGTGDLRLSAGPQRRLGRGDGENGEGVPTGVVPGTHSVASSHGGVFSGGRQTGGAGERHSGDPGFC